MTPGTETGAEFPMTNVSNLKHPGFVLESADSVRFGPEYTADEQEWNRQMLFGEMLCGLLMGEQLWTNAVFAFDSRGTVEVLGAIARAFIRRPRSEQFLPFLLSVYDQDKDTWSSQWRKWQTPGELYLRCYAHRLNNLDFQLSATPELGQDQARRKRLAGEICRLAETGGGLDDIKTVCSDAEADHLRNIFDIDRYFRSWLDSAAAADFESYASKNAQLSFPIRLNRAGWADAYADNDAVRSLRYFLEKAVGLLGSNSVVEILPPEPVQVLQDAIQQLAATDTAFKDRSSFRTWLKGQGHPEQSVVYRLLTELTDGHYVRTQQSVLTYADREITSPASQSPSSQAGEKWATATMRACLKNKDISQSWQFINEIKAASSLHPLKIDLDNIAAHFADYITHPERRRDLLTYHELLDHARRDQMSKSRQPIGEMSASVMRLPDFAKICCNNINLHLSATCGVGFRFNTNDAATGAGSLTFVYLENQATNQCTGTPLEVAGQQSEGASNEISQTAPL